MNTLQTSTFLPLPLRNFNPHSYLEKFNARSLTSHEPHIQELLTHLAQDGADRPFTIKDPIHGDRELPTWALRIINTPPLLRLSQVGQMTLMPHSRLSHSIGVAILAGDLAEAHKLEEAHKRTLVSLALLHDVGHGPYSHMCERLYLETKSDSFNHDRRLRDVLNHLTLEEALAHVNVTPATIADSLKSPDTDPHGYIVKVLCDRIDYVMRDAENSGERLSREEKQAIRNAAMNLFCSIQYHPNDRWFCFSDSPQTLSAMEKFVEMRHLAFDRLAYDEDSRLAESLILSHIKNKILHPNTTPEARKDLVVALSYYSDADLKSLLPNESQAIIDQAKAGASLGLVRFDGASVTTTFHQLQNRVSSTRGPIKTIIEELKLVDPHSAFLVAIVPSMPHTITFRMRAESGVEHEITSADLISSEEPSKEIKSIAISRYGHNGIEFSAAEKFQKQVQEVFVRKGWIRPPEIDLESKSFSDKR